PSRAVEAWFQPRRFALVMVALVCPSFPSVLFSDRTFVYRDFGYVTYPFAYYFRECFWRGELPLWNPLSMCGIPFLAQWNTQVLYPPALIYLVLPMPWSLNVFLLAHLVLGGVGMCCLAQRWTGSTFAGCVAGVAYAFSGLSVNALTWVHATAALGLMPWVVLWVERGWTDGRR